MMTSQNIEWLVPPENLSLAKNEVHVWRVALDQSEAIIRRMAQTLAPDEASRAARFHFERDRQHYTIGRGILRELIGSYLKFSPQAVQFSYGPQDKPAIANTGTAQDLRFNISHSHGQAVFAFAWQREMGVDIEQIRALDDAEDIAKRFFSARDCATFLSLPPNQRNEGFFNCWTRKEAYIKALGEGLSHPLDTFDVSLKPGDPAQLLSVKDHPAEVVRWRMMSLNPMPGYVAALLVEGQDWVLKCWHWEPG